MQDLVVDLLERMLLYKTRQNGKDMKEQCNLYRLDSNALIYLESRLDEGLHCRRQDGTGKIVFLG